MKSQQLVTAVVVAMTLGWAWPVGAETPENQEKKSLHNSRRGSSTTAPTNPAATQQNKAPDEASKGRNSSAAGGTRERISGTGGAAKAQDPTASPSTSTTPTSGNTLVNPNKPKPDDGKVVGPEYFKSKEQQLRDLANPGVPTDSTPPPGGDAAAKRLNPTGSDVLGNVSTTVAPGYGKNPSSTREEHSEVSGTFKQEGSTGVVTLTGNRGSVEFRASNDGKMLRETVTMRDSDSTTVMVKDYTTKTTTITVSLTGGYVFRQINEGKLIRIKMPSPETDSGGGPLPKGAPQDTPKKSPSELEAERRRQVTEPTDDQRAQFERVKMDAMTALKSAAAKRTEGRIDENPVGDGAVGATGAAKAGTGKGCVQAGCPPNPGGPSKTGQ